MSKENISILIVDDEEMIVDEFLFFLEQFGYNVKGLTDSKIANEKLKKEKFDIVITDLKMPEVSGMDLAKTVRQYSPETLIFIITGFATVDSVIEAIQKGVYDYIRKPFKFKEIKIAIERAVEQIQLRRENKLLNQKIQQMLSYITTLYDISSILYQITDFSMVLDMIIDTITEGLNIPRSAIFLYNEQSLEFSVTKNHGLTEEFIKNCRLTPESTINGRKLSAIQATIIDNISGELKIDETILKIDEEVDYFIIAPIKFHNKIMGYLSILINSTDVLPLEDEVKLVNIISTQVAPIFQRKFAVKSDDSEQVKKLAPVSESIMEQYITNAEKINNSVSFIMGKIIRNNADLEISRVADMQSLLNEIIVNEIDELVIILWQAYDSFLLIIPECNPAMSDIIVSNIKNKFEKKAMLSSDEPTFSFQYFSTSYPYDKLPPEKLLQIMSDKLFFAEQDLEE